MRNKHRTLVYLLMSIGPTFNATGRRERIPANVWKVFITNFQAVNDASIAVKLSKFPNCQLENSEKNFDFSNKILELVNELKSAGHLITEIERKRELLRGLSKEVDVTVEAIMSSVVT